VKGALKAYTLHWLKNNQYSAAAQTEKRLKTARYGSTILSTAQQK